MKEFENYEEDKIENNNHIQNESDEELEEMDRKSREDDRLELENYFRAIAPDNDEDDSIYCTTENYEIVEDRAADYKADFKENDK